MFSIIRILFNVFARIFVLPSSSSSVIFSYFHLSPFLPPLIVLPCVFIFCLMLHPIPDLIRNLIFMSPRLCYFYYIYTHILWVLSPSYPLLCSRFFFLSQLYILVFCNCQLLAHPIVDLWKQTFYTALFPLCWAPLLLLPLFLFVGLYFFGFSHFAQIKCRFF